MMWKMFNKLVHRLSYNYLLLPMIKRNRSKYVTHLFYTRTSLIHKETGITKMKKYIYHVIEKKNTQLEDHMIPLD